MHYDALRKNPLASFSDAARAAEDCIRPYLPFVAAGKVPGMGGSSFKESTIRLEMTSRLLWAAVPLAAGTRSSVPLAAGTRFAVPFTAADKAGSNPAAMKPAAEPSASANFIAGSQRSRESGIEILARSVAEGTNPESIRYWGIPENHDQILVEMPAIALAIVLTPTTFRDALSPEELKRYTGLAHLDKPPRGSDMQLAFLRSSGECRSGRIPSGGRRRETNAIGFVRYRIFLPERRMV